MSQHYHVVRYGLGGREASEPIGDFVTAAGRLQSDLEALADRERARGAEVTVTQAGGRWDLTAADEFVHGVWSFGITGCSVRHLSPQPPPMTVRAEVWALSADEAGIWLVSGAAAWTSPDVLADSEPHESVQVILREHNALGAAKIVHSTSWRPDGPAIVLSYCAALSCEDVLNHWPGAQPVSTLLPRAVGKPATHAADDVPVPRDVDVLLHALRHLSFLERYDATAKAAMSVHWRSHLRAFEPALAGMYSATHQPEVISEAS